MVVWAPFKGCTCVPVVISEPETPTVRTIVGDAQVAFAMIHSTGDSGGQSPILGVYAAPISLPASVRF